LSQWLGKLLTPQYLDDDSLKKPDVRRSLEVTIVELRKWRSHGRIDRSSMDRLVGAGIDVAAHRLPPIG
jgi:hypothetical protein